MCEKQEHLEINNNQKPVNQLINNDILILGIGVSVHKTDGVIRFERFCKAYNLPYKIIGEGKVWRGGDMFVGTGGGQKINELLEAIKPMENKLIIMCDTYDQIPIAGKEEIISKFHKLTKSWASSFC